MVRSGFLSTAERCELERCVRCHREDHGIARRANAILLLDDGESCAQIARFLYLDDDTVRGWYKAYSSDGWEVLAHDAWQGGKCLLTQDQQVQLVSWLEGRLCRSTVEIRSYIAAEFKLVYSHSGCLKLLHRLGFEYKKPKAVPRVGDEEAQQAFIDMYEALLNGLSDDEAVYFADAVHPEYQTKPAFGWVKKGADIDRCRVSVKTRQRLLPVDRFKHSRLDEFIKTRIALAVKTTCGRGRVNIHGAICLENFDAPFVEPVTVDANSAIQLLARIEANNPTLSLINVIWDNAAYHRCEEVKKWLSRPECRIRLIQLPPYCPHLNPIERLWAVMHEYVTHNRLYPTQKEFADAILAFFREIIPKQWNKFRDKVTDNFRIISNQNTRILE